MPQESTPSDAISSVNKEETVLNPVTVEEKDYSALGEVALEVLRNPKSTEKEIADALEAVEYHNEDHAPPPPRVLKYKNHLLRAAAGGRQKKPVRTFHGVQARVQEADFEIRVLGIALLFMSHARLTIL